MKILIPLLFYIINITLIESLKYKLQCSKPTLRKEIRELTNDEFTRYVNAVRRLHASKTPIGLSEYELFTKTHVDNKPYAHAKPAFLAWHRRFLREYEKKLQRIDPRVVLPYWDWSLDADEPHKSLVLSSERMGSNGNATAGMCVTDGVFKFWDLKYPFPHCLKRSYNGGNIIKKFQPTEHFITLLNEKKFSYFSRKLELYHGGPHNGIGAHPGDFGPIHSPNDPIFYLHHGFIDMIWWQWQQRNQNLKLYDGVKYKKHVSTKNLLTPFGVTVQSTFDTLHPYYCYTYPEYPRRIAPLGPTGTKGARTVKPPRLGTNPLLDKYKNLTLDEMIYALKMDNKGSARALDLQTILDRKNGKQKVAKAEPLPKEWLEENGFDEEDAREEEKKSDQLSDLLNSIPGFEPFNKF